jgi:hypothetical protein
MSHLPSRTNLGRIPLRAYPDTMDKKEIESPKLTENFLVWIGAFMLLIFLLLAHFVWRVF